MAYLIDTENNSYGPFASIDEGCKHVIGDLPGIADFAMINLRYIFVEKRDDRSDHWIVRGDLRTLETHRIDALHVLLQSVAMEGDRIDFLPIRETFPVSGTISSFAQTFDILQGRHVPMRIRTIEASDLEDAKLYGRLTQAWIADNKSCGAAVENVIKAHNLRQRMLAFSTKDLRLTWVGAGLIFLSDDPMSLYGAPITELGDREFVEGIVPDWMTVTAAPVPSLRKISTPLNGRSVEYAMLSLPNYDPQRNLITGCVRIPMDLWVRGEAPANFNEASSVYNTHLLAS